MVELADSQKYDTTASQMRENGGKDRAEDGDHGDADGDDDYGDDHRGKPGREAIDGLGFPAEAEAAAPSGGDDGSKSRDYGLPGPHMRLPHQCSPSPLEVDRDTRRKHTRTYIHIHKCSPLYMS